MKSLLMPIWVTLVVLLAGPLQAEDVQVQTYPDGTAVRILSPAPAPGIHPRIFLSPEDLPAFRKEVLSSAPRKLYYAKLQGIIAKGLDDPKTPAGKVIAELAQGQTPNDSDYASAGEVMSNLLFLASIDATVTDDHKRQAQLAQALSAWGSYQLVHWVRPIDKVGLHNGFDLSFCLAYDFTAAWMSEAQRDPARKYIVRLCDGIHIFTYNMPPHWRMWNWAALHVYQGYGSLAIEGESGYNPQLWNEAKMVVRDIGKYNVHPSGALTEDLTYFTLGFEGTGPVMIAMAKRGDQDIWDTSNISKLKYHLLNQLYPWGGEFQSHADGFGNGFYTSFALWKYMYPTDPIIDYTWRNRTGEDYTNGGASNDESIRTWVVTLFGTEHATTMENPADFKQPLTYFCPDRGYLVGRTGWDAGSIKIDFEAKQDYPIVGHNHADPNNFNLDALGRAWVTDTGYHDNGGHQHNEVMIDGVPESPWPCPGGRWVDLIDNPSVLIGVSDAKHAYDYHWSDTGYTVDNNPPSDLEKWEKETDPKVVEFYKGQENRETTGIFDHWSPFLLRSTWNPVEKAFRTLALVKGPHPYVFIVDDIKKDDSAHLYQWIQQMPEDVEILRNGGNWVVLGAKEMPSDPKDKKSKPIEDNRRLLVQLVDADATDHASAMAIQLESFISSPSGAYNKASLHTRLTIPARGVEPHYKVLLYPFLEGAELPELQWNDEHTQCSLIWKDQTDTYIFGTGESGRTIYKLDRDGINLAVVKAAPAAPKVVSSAHVFTDSIQVAFQNPAPGEEIHYTVDGSEPTLNSPFYEGPISVSQSATIRSATFARAWIFGDQAKSAVTEVAVNKENLVAPVAVSSITPGLKVSIYKGYWNDLPDFSALTPFMKTSTDQFTLPPQTPVKGFGVSYSGYVNVAASGVYTFGYTCDDAGKIWIDDQLVVDQDGPHVVQTRTGQIALAAGWHKIAVANCDNALPHGKLKGDGSWAFSVLWTPPNAGGLSEIPPTVLGQDATDAIPIPPLTSVAADSGTATEPGLYEGEYDQTEVAGTPAFFDVSKSQPLTALATPSIVTPDSSEYLLHVYRGYLKIPHAGSYQFALASSGIGEISCGETVVFRCGLDEGNLALPVHLEQGNIPFTIKMAKNMGAIQWKGPGMDWQSLSSSQLVRAVRPQVITSGQVTDDLFCELPTPQDVTLAVPETAQRSVIRYTLDGTDPIATSTQYASPISISKDCVLKARLFEGTSLKPVGEIRTASFTISKAPTKWMIGYWPADKVEDGKIPNQCKPGVSDLPMPNGTPIVDDPEHGKVLVLDVAPKLVLANPGILKNDVTLAFWLKPKGKAVLVHHGYAHFGFFFNLNDDGSVSGAGGGSWSGVKTGPMRMNQWHQITLTVGGLPIRQEQVYIDGELSSEIHLNAPAIAKSLELLEGYSGELAEIRLYNRILGVEEVKALAKKR